MTSTSSTTLRRRRLTAAVLALPLALAMTSTAVAATSSTTGSTTGSTTAELRSSGGSAGKATPAPAAAQAPQGTSVGAAAGAASGTSAANATTTNTSYTNGNANSSKADRPNAPVTKSAAPSQPLSTADRTGRGANPGGTDTCNHAYCSNNTGVEPDNGNDSAPAKGQPCAGCVGKADNKNPQGQAPNGSDLNAGYECDRNQGVGQKNPAHTGCTSASPVATAKPTKSPTARPTRPSSPSPKPSPSRTADNGTATITVKVDCRTVVVTSSKDISHVVVFFKDGTSQKFDGLSGKTWTRTFTQDLSSARAKSATSTATGTATGCGVLPTGTPTPPTTCPDGSAMPANGKPCKDDDDDRKVSICHATGSPTNPYVLIEISEKALKEHREHQDGRDIIPAPARGCPGGTGEDRITICHATGNAASPYELVTVNRQGLDGHGGHAGDIIPAPANGTCPGGTTTFDQCPDMAGLQPAGTSCTQPPLTTTLFCPDGSVMPAGNPVNCPVPPRDVCPNQDGMQLMGPCNNGNGGGGGGGGGTPIQDVTEDQPAINPVPVGPPTVVPPVIVPNGTRPPALIGTVDSPANRAATRPAAVRPSALPFTGTDAALLVELGALLLLAGGGVLVAARRERTARAR